MDLHRLILGVTDPGIYVDHLDGFGLNNRRYNLNPTTPRGNMETKKSWRIERNRQSGLYEVIVVTVCGWLRGPSRTVPELFRSSRERYGKRDYLEAVGIVPTNG